MNNSYNNQLDNYNIYSYSSNIYYYDNNQFNDYNNSYNGMNNSSNNNNDFLSNNINCINTVNFTKDNINNNILNYQLNIINCDVPMNNNMNSTIKYYNNNAHILNTENNYLMINNDNNNYDDSPAKIQTNTNQKFQNNELNREKMGISSNNIGTKINYNNSPTKSKEVEIYFQSSDNQIHNYKIKCKNSDIFCVIKEEIENEFPYLNQKKVQFISNGIQIKPLKTLE